MDRSGVEDRAGNTMDAAGSSQGFLGGAVTAARAWELYR